MGLRGRPLAHVPTEAPGGGGICRCPRVDVHADAWGDGARIGVVTLIRRLGFAANRPVGVTRRCPGGGGLLVG
jgi:hypothetical protein